MRRPRNIFGSLWKACVVVLGTLLVSGCNMAPQYNAADWTNRIENCWPCAIYGVVLQAIDKTLEATITMVAEASLVFLGVGLLFWLAFRVIKFAGSFKTPDVHEFISALMVTLGKAIIVAAFLSNAQLFISLLGEAFVQPVLLMFTDVSRTFLTTDESIAQYMRSPETINGLISVGATGISMNAQASNSLLGDTPIYIQDIIYRLFVLLRAGTGLGISVMVDTGVFGFFIGLYVIYMFFVMSLILPLLFADSFVRLGCLLILTPLALVGWVFPNDFLKRPIGVIIKGVLVSMFDVLFTCIFIGLVISVIVAYTDQFSPGLLSATRHTTDSQLAKDVNNMSNTFIAFLFLLFVFNRLTYNIPKISGKFGGGGATSSLTGMVRAIKSGVRVVAGAAMAATGVGAGVGSRMMASGAEDLASQATGADKK
ncbi:MAG: hypothetical protein PHX68_01815 [Alphaproteobacteria bacterium]|nr:hypothetical protein [Alphaproteobacteria bacterium]